MASLEPPNSPSNNPSFTIRVATKHNKFMRSSSISNNLTLFNISQPSTPRLSFTLSTSKLDESQVTYKCISSVLKKDGQILCIAVSTGIVYTGSQTTIVDLNLPEFT
ncbi:hypothetical protein Leryth_010236 [Lithospermum erythrorhizon]|nr:hypothetical protein Leryth_010236 [Lithospermum erythrorhizon]